MRLGRNAPGCLTRSRFSSLICCVPLSWQWLTNERLPLSLPLPLPLPASLYALTASPAPSYSRMRTGMSGVEAPGGHGVGLPTRFKVSDLGFRI